MCLLILTVSQVSDVAHGPLVLIVNAFPRSLSHGKSFSSHSWSSGEGGFSVDLVVETFSQRCFRSYNVLY